MQAGADELRGALNIMQPDTMKVTPFGASEYPEVVPSTRAEKSREVMAKQKETKRPRYR
jgi:hypothetical protein